MCSMSYDWWKEAADRAPPDAAGACAGARVWAAACAAAGVAPADTWQRLVDSSPSDDRWHSLNNCVAYQMGAFQHMRATGTTAPPTRPAAFELALAMRHTPLPVARALLQELFQAHPQAEPLTQYVLALLTYDESTECLDDADDAAAPAALAAPLRDIKLFTDCELVIHSAPPQQYDAHARLVRAEYAHLTQRAYLQLRIKVLNQLFGIPRLYRTADFTSYERPAQGNIKREIAALEEQLSTDRAEAS